jgi:hypothetical protein
MERAEVVNDSSPGTGITVIRFKKLRRRYKKRKQGNPKHKPKHKQSLKQTLNLKMGH